MLGKYKMSEMTDIEGIDVLLQKLPEKLQHWSNFHYIDEFKFENVFDDEETFEYIRNIEMVLTDYAEQYRIRMKLKDVCGLISFDAVNGFYDGLVIDDLKENGYSERRYRFSSCEMDMDFNFYCKKISVELEEYPEMQKKPE